MGDVFTRQVDKMGRIVIPKEIRDQLDFMNQVLSIEVFKDSRGISVAKTGNKTEDTKSLDNYGRLLIPIELRQKLGWEQGKELEITLEKNKAVLQDQMAQCQICGSTDALLAVKQAFICEGCLQEGLEKNTNEWTSFVDELVYEYQEECLASLNFENTEDVHQARVKGRRLSALLGFIGLTSDHGLMDKIHRAHGILGKVRERDVLIEEFEKRADNEEDEDKAKVYQQVAEKVAKKREKHRKRMQQELPEVIDQEFLDLWSEFKNRTFRKYVFIVDVTKRLEEYEEAFNQKVEDYQQSAANEGVDSEDALDELHRVRIESKYLRYIYRYLHDIYNEDYKEQADHYKSFQRQFGTLTICVIG
ncbi:CHAD domain-containing protein [Halobacillus salinarum]|uniref:CHAD domain-containing protein n=1 Tax=Halobacillus salinarum TaxID=2932257 RepID=A0ABY4EKR2_9BACI|nr:CHAD domain-containing protein [Halobacillus salinarum]UOQ45055.1 CHAD domain-containing protein [Halobacillus salinarum]